MTTPNMNARGNTLSQLSAFFQENYTLSTFETGVQIRVSPLVMPAVSKALLHVLFCWQAVAYTRHYHHSELSMNEAQKAYLNKYLESLNPEQRNTVQNVVADYFCADEENADICADLVRRGEKTATCSMKYWYETELEPIPTVGSLQIVTDWHGNPTSIIETTDVFEYKYSEVTAELAALEGEGDKTLDWWRKAHWDFFAAECQEQGIEPSHDMVLIFEKFKVVYS